MEEDEGHCQEDENDAGPPNVYRCHWVPDRAGCLTWLDRHHKPRLEREMLRVGEVE